MRNTIGVGSDVKRVLGTKMERDGKIYVVVSCRKMIEALGEPRGYFIELEEKSYYDNTRQA